MNVSDPKLNFLTFEMGDWSDCYRLTREGAVNRLWGFLGN